MSDKEILVELFHDWKGSTWTKKDNWLTSKPIKTWYGVSVSKEEEDTVIGLNLAMNGLKGVITDTITGLPMLEKLDLNGNNMKGCIPASLSQLLRLEELNIHGNKFEDGYHNLLWLPCKNIRFDGMMEEHLEKYIIKLSKDGQRPHHMEVAMWLKNPRSKQFGEREKAMSLLLSTFDLFDEIGGIDPDAAFFWIHILTATSLQKVLQPVMTEMLDKKYDFIREFAFVEDEEGRRAIDIALPGYRKLLEQRMLFMQRFELKEGPPEYQTETTMIVLGVDKVGNSKTTTSAVATSTSKTLPTTSSTSTSKSLPSRKTVGRKVDSKDGKERRESKEGKGSSKAVVETKPGDTKQQQISLGVVKGAQLAFKFISNKALFMSEVVARRESGFEPEYVLGMEESIDGDENAQFLKESEIRGYYPYCIIMPAADRNLATMIAQERLAGRDWDVIRVITSHALEALAHVHSKGVIHGNINLLNIMRHNNRIKLVYSDVTIVKGGLVGLKYSSGYVPPEMVTIRGDGSATVRSYEIDETTNTTNIEALPYAPLTADFSYDTWSLGVVLYHLFAAEPLFLMDTDGNIDESQLRILYQWPNSFKTQRLSRIPDRLARNLLSRLLTKQPLDRPSAVATLRHPFFQDSPLARLPGDSAEFDVFICCREGTDDERQADLLAKTFIGRGLQVFVRTLSVVSDEDPWEYSFFDGLASSKVFVCLLSKEAVRDPENDRNNFEKISSSSPVDQLLLEIRLAFELLGLELLERIVPILIGERVGEDQYSPYDFSGRWASDSVVASVEDRVASTLEAQGLGAPLETRVSPRDIMSQLLHLQTCRIFDKGGIGRESAAQVILGMLHSREEFRKESIKEGLLEQDESTRLKLQDELKRLGDEVAVLREDLRFVQADKADLLWDVEAKSSQVGLLEIEKKGLLLKLESVSSKGVLSNGHSPATDEHMTSLLKGIHKVTHTVIEMTHKPNKTEAEMLAEKLQSKSFSDGDTHDSDQGDHDSTGDVPVKRSRRWTTGGNKVQPMSSANTLTVSDNDTYISQLQAVLNRIHGELFDHGHAHISSAYQPQFANHVKRVWVRHIGSVQSGRGTTLSPMAGTTLLTLDPMWNSLHWRGPDKKLGESFITKSRFRGDGPLVWYSLELKDSPDVMPGKKGDLKALRILMSEGDRRVENIDVTFSDALLRDAWIEILSSIS